MLQKLAPLVRARVAIACEHFISPRDPSQTYLVGLTEWGWQKAEQDLFYEHLNSGGMVRDPLHEPVKRLEFRSFTRRRRDFVPDNIWYASPIVDPLRRRCNVDDSLHTRCRLPQPGWSHAMTFMRSWGQEPFSIRDRFLVSLFHRELGQLWRKVDSGPLASLSPRLRQTLDLILCGYSEKEMAAALNVSIHTAHDFAKRLYRHFSVAGRGGLIVQAECRQLLLRPALSPAYSASDRGDLEGTFPQPDLPGDP